MTAAGSSDHGAATEKSCGPDIDAAERMLHEAIRGATLDGDTLVLETPHGDLEFERSS